MAPAPTSSDALATHREQCPLSPRDRASAEGGRVMAPTMPAWLNPGVVTLVGALLVALGTFWGFARQTSSAQKLAEKSEEIAGLNRQLAEKSEEIAKLAKENLATITGGDSFCY